MCGQLSVLTVDEDNTQSNLTATKYFVHDGLGSVRQVADSSGGVLLAQTFATPPEFERRYFYDTESAWQDGARSPRE
jgi:hypothetical protein